jgi:hypothetical protein
MNAVYRLRFILVALLPAGSIWGQLTWPKTEIQLAAERGQKVASARYEYRNDGQRPVSIATVVPSCGCLTTKLSQATLAPGETGTLSVDFNINEESGRVEKMVSVMTDEVPLRTQHLTLIVTIPETIAIEPRVLFWNRGDVDQVQTVVIRVADPAILRVQLGNLADGAFTAELRRTAAAGNYALNIKPTATTSALQRTIPVVAHYRDYTKTYFVLVGVR